MLDVGLVDATDTEIWEHASRNDCVVISKDEDFLYLANAAGAQARFIWIRSGTAGRRRFLAAIESLWPRVEAVFEAGDRIIELH